MKKQYFVVVVNFCDGQSAIVAVKEDRELAHAVVKAHEQDKEEYPLIEGYNVIHVVDDEDPSKITAFVDLVKI